jgi:2-dehydropantoate 2-reductase
VKIAIIGAGAIGGMSGRQLALAGNRVTFIVRGANLDAIRARGIRLIAPTAASRSPPTSRPRRLQRRRARRTW